MNTDNVFTPGRYPRANFIIREEHQLKETIDQTQRTGAPIHLVGPPDSGKTSLAQHATADQPLLTVRGTEISETDDVARQLFADLTDGETALPPTLTPSEERIEQVRDEPRDQLRVVQDALRTGQIALLYDDFHAMPDDVQVYVAQLLKGQYERGIDIFVTSADSGRGDLTLANGDLSGRVRFVDVPAWTTSDLSTIARNGFDTLDVGVDEHTIASLADRADGSPTEMHHLCVETL
jgi:hypothetical protein